MECNYCMGEMEKAMTIYTGKVKGGVIIIENIECNKCTQCGSETYNEPEAELISRITRNITNIPLKLAVTDAEKWKDQNEN